LGNNGLFSAICPAGVISIFSELTSQMSSLQQRLAAVTDAAANLIAQLCELNELRDRVRKAQLSARRSRRTNNRKRARI
jgi:hypothetical protein